MNDIEYKQQISEALQRFQSGELSKNAVHLLGVLGYRSDNQIDLDSNHPDAFFAEYDQQGTLNRDKLLSADWDSIDLLFQLTGDDLTLSNQRGWRFDSSVKQVDNTIIESYLFFALQLRNDNYTRTQLSQITREINKLFPMPVMLLLQHGQTLTFSIIDRRLHKRDESKDVLEKVTLIKDIDFSDPHRAHIEILFDLALEQLHKTHGVHNFVELHRAWKKTLDTSELSKQFYDEIANWYFWAVDQVTFPADVEKDEEIRNATNIIRLITRLIFVWFIKEKGLLQNTLFDKKQIDKILKSTDPQKSTYYKAILQNLFFATLNTEMKPDNRKFRHRARQSRGRDQHYMVHSLYRYERYFKHPKKALGFFKKIPFLNGGLFECLDKDTSKKILRVDGFSDRNDNQLHVPNFLFFSDEQSVDLNEAYGTKDKQYKVRGLIDILNRYKFTIAENTPIEEEVALDPELLGKVFENLLAAYNPETQTTARKLTGSFYTPREIVNYMTDESLISYFKSTLIACCEFKSTLSATTPPSQLNLSGQTEPVQTRLDMQKKALSKKQKVLIESNLRHLITYNDEPHRFSDEESEQLIKAIDDLKILDPACGSGEFPMGILRKLVFILGKLDPGNDQWRQRQIARVETTIETAEKIDDSTIRENTIRDLEREIDNINEAFERNELDYGRKLYLIENCIYGVDIQPIAVQISKLRFFISLIVDQKIDNSRENRGVRPLPNLETKFVAANTLLSVDKPAQISFRNPQIDLKEKELAEVRRKHFIARTPRTKAKYRDQDDLIRAEISKLLKLDGFPSETTEKIAYWNPYDQNTTADWFDAEWMFGITEGFDVVIGNPPYVRQEKIKALKPALKKRYACYTGTSDLYVYFYERGLELLKVSGIQTFICSNSWLDVNYGAPLQKYLLENTSGAVICHSEASREFESADINTIVSILQNGSHDADSHIRFITFKTFIGDSSLENRRERRRTYAELKQDGRRNGKYTGDKWGGKYLRAPDIYWTLLEKGKDKLVRLADIAEVRYGIKTGANEFFYLDDEQIETWGIEAKFLRPFLKSSRECKSIRIDPDQLQSKLFICHLDKAALVGTAALEYIEWGESQGFHQRPSCRSRAQWWDLGGQKSFDWLVLIFRDKRNWTPINEIPSLLASNVVFTATLHNRDTIQSANAVANSTFAILASEIYGRVNLGDGLLTTYGPDILSFDFISPDWIDAHSGQSLGQAFESMKQRQILSIFDEIHQPDRRALDAIIFDALGFTQGERDGVYEAVIHLVEARLRKAKSLKG